MIMKKILIIDDDIDIGNMLEETLIKEGYGVLRAYSGTEALFVLSQSKPDLVLLDLMLPGLNGEGVLLQIKGVPTIIVSAKTDIDNKVDLLFQGAVDYITKPFNMKELLARISVHLRNTVCISGSSPLLFDDIVLDTDTHIVRVNCAEVRLTRTEYAILKLLMQNPLQVITKSLLLEFANFMRLKKDKIFWMECIFMFMAGIVVPLLRYRDMKITGYGNNLDNGFFGCALFIRILLSVFCSLFI